MGLVVATTLGLCLWVVLWALGAKAFDAFLLTILIVMVSATARIFSPYLPGNRE
jgi:hypothetical protein